MNYEEMLRAQENSGGIREAMPLGDFCRKQIDRKYKNVVELKPELTDSLVFAESLRRDQQTCLQVKDAHQLCYEMHEDSGGIYELELQSGNYQPLSQLLNENPAVVAERGFMDRFVESLMALTEKLHEMGVYHLCYAPQTILMRKSDNSPMLLCHGSSFLGLKDQQRFYAGFESTLAPEVLAGETVDGRSDIYGLGRLIEQLCVSGKLSYEYKGVVKKATAEDPDKRYSTIAEMRQALGKRRGMKRSLWLGLAATAVVALGVFLFFDLMPEASNVEFVDDNGLVQKTDPFSEEFDEPFVDDQDEYLDPEIKMYMDSIGMDEMTDDEFHALADSVQQYTRVEEIFRRRFEQQASSKLNKLYGNGNLGSSESDFIAHSNTTMQELIDYAKELSEQTGLPAEQANSLASQIISRMQAQMQSGVQRYGSMTGGKKNDDD